jgi:hypothetical protein
MITRNLKPGDEAAFKGDRSLTYTEVQQLIAEALDKREGGRRWALNDRKGCSFVWKFLCDGGSKLFVDNGMIRLAVEPEKLPAWLSVFAHGAKDLYLSVHDKLGKKEEADYMAEEALGILYSAYMELEAVRDERRTACTDPQRP